MSIGTIAEWGYDRDAATKMVVPRYGSVVHVVNTECVYCNQQVTQAEFDDEVAWPSRINGDSYYGYEVYHTACLPD